jgi:hypothetical protein
LNWRAVWQWIDRDLDQIRPLSMLLILLPFIPFAIALELPVSSSTEDALLIAGFVVAMPWFLYVVWRGLRNVARSFRETGRYFRDNRSNNSPDS